MNLLTIYEVADVLRVSTATVKRLWSSGKFPEPRRVGHQLRWRREVVEQWLENTEAEKGTA